MMISKLPTLNSRVGRSPLSHGVFWMLMMCVVNNLNDVIMKMVSMDLPFQEVTFFRFVFGFLFLLPFVAKSKNREAFTCYPLIHITRGVLLFVALTLWCYGVSQTPITTATLLGFTSPFFILPLAQLFLRESVTLHCWLAISIGFLGVSLVIRPHVGELSTPTLILVLSVFLFSVLDVVNKGLLVAREGILPLMFYSALSTTLLSFLPAYFVWQAPTLDQLVYLLILGAGANLTLYCLLQAYKCTNIISIQPFRYAELLFSCLTGFIIFNELPNTNIMWGGALVIAAGWFVFQKERRKEKL